MVLALDKEEEDEEEEKEEEAVAEPSPFERGRARLATAKAVPTLPRSTSFTTPAQLCKGEERRAVSSPQPPNPEEGVGKPHSELGGQRGFVAFAE